MRSWSLALLGIACLPGGRWLTAFPAVDAPAAVSQTTRSRVVIVHDPAATENFVPVSNVVAAAVIRGLTTLTHRPTATEAWRSLVSTQDTVGIKVYAKPGPVVGTRLGVVETVVEGLLAAGLPPRHIVVWDRHLADLRSAGYFDLAERYGVRVAGSAEAGWAEGAFYESPLIGRLVWGDREFGKEGSQIGRRSFGSRLVVSEMTKIISVVPLLNHNQLGVAGHLLGLSLGSVDNVLRFESTVGFMVEAVPEILADENLGISDRWVLSITDALLGQYQGEDRQLLHYSVVLNELWFSQDPVALDVLGVNELEIQRQAVGNPRSQRHLELYENAALVELGTSRLEDMDIVRVGGPRPGGPSRRGTNVMAGTTRASTPPAAGASEAAGLPPR